jgi:hypothetical protein
LRVVLLTTQKISTTPPPTSFLSSLRSSKLYILHICGPTLLLIFSPSLFFCLLASRGENSFHYY